MTLMKKKVLKLLLVVEEKECFTCCRFMMVFVNTFVFFRNLSVGLMVSLLLNSESITPVQFTYKR